MKFSNKSKNSEKTNLGRNSQPVNHFKNYMKKQGKEEEVIDSKVIKRITTDEINIFELINSLKDKKGNSGATVIFIGSVRNYGNNGLVKGMFYESYIKMAEIQIKNIEKKVAEKWNIKKIRIVHRIGSMKLGCNSIVIALSTPHSKEAFEACEFILAAIKKEVPIWKKEILSDNKKKWVVGNPLNKDR